MRRLYTSVKLITIVGFGDGSPFALVQAIARTNADLMPIGSFKQTSVNLYQITKYNYQENSFGHVVCKMAIILLRVQYVDWFLSCVVSTLRLGKGQFMYCGKPNPELIDFCQNESSHDDVIKWKHFRCNLPFVRGIHMSPVDSPHKGLWGWALMFPLIWAWTNGWPNNRDADDLRRHRSHYDVTAMIAVSNGMVPSSGVGTLHAYNSLWKIWLWQWWSLTISWKLQSRLCVTCTENMLKHSDIKCSICVQMDIENCIKWCVIDYSLERTKNLFHVEIYSKCLRKSTSLVINRFCWKSCKLWMPNLFYVWMNVIFRCNNIF